MPGAMLTQSSTIRCPHQGVALLFTNDRKARAGTLALLETDVHFVLGCTFMVGTTYSPCVKIEWSGGATSTTVNGAAVLVKSSIGTCKNLQGAVQGLAVISDTQTKVTAK